LPKNVNQTEYR